MQIDFPEAVEKAICNRVEKVIQDVRENVRQRKGMMDYSENGAIREIFRRIEENRFSDGAGLGEPHPTVDAKDLERVWLCIARQYIKIRLNHLHESKS